MYKGSLFPHPHQYFCLFGNSHLNKCEVISHCDFDFSDDSWCCVPFDIPTDICMYYLEKWVLEYFTHISFCLFCYWGLYIFQILISFQIYGLQIFCLYSVDCLPFGAEAFIWGNSIYSFLLLLPGLLMMMLKNHCPEQC